MGGNGFPNATIIIEAITTSITTLAMSAFWIAMAFHYFSLKEQKENFSLLYRIDEISAKNEETEDNNKPIY